MSGVTAIMIALRLSMVRNPVEILVLDSGRIVEVARMRDCFCNTAITRCYGVLSIRIQEIYCLRLRSAKTNLPQCQPKPETVAYYFSLPKIAMPKMAPSTVMVMTISRMR